MNPLPVAALVAMLATAAGAAPALTLAWADNYLRIRGGQLPGGEIPIHYLEAYCRDQCQTADWVTHTVVGHKTELLSANADQTEIRLRCVVSDGLIVEHLITAGADEVDFRISAHNPTAKRSAAHWAQPCIRVGAFSGFGPADTDDAYAYLRHSFVFLDGKLTTMPTPRWATEARYRPGQVWAGPRVPRSDVNPRPLSPETI